MEKKITVIKKFDGEKLWWNVLVDGWTEKCFHNEADAINKSYPGFYGDLEKLGAVVQYDEISAGLKER